MTLYFEVFNSAPFRISDVSSMAPTVCTLFIYYIIINIVNKWAYFVATSGTVGFFYGGEKYIYIFFFKSLFLTAVYWRMLVFWNVTLP